MVAWYSLNISNYFYYYITSIYGSLIVLLDVKLLNIRFRIVGYMGKNLCFIFCSYNREFNGM